MLLSIDTYYYLMNHEKDENSNGQLIVVTQNGKNPAPGTPNVDRIPDQEQKSSIVTAKIEPIPFFPNAVGNPPHVIKEIKSTVSKIDSKFSFLFLNSFC